MPKALFIILTLVCVQIIRVTSYNLTIHPEQENVDLSTVVRKTVDFTCNAGVNLTGCQFMLLDRYNIPGPVLDLSQWESDQADPVSLNSSQRGYLYHGIGLDQGQCGISLNVTGYQHTMVACRVRPLSGGWKYAWTNLYASRREIIPNFLTPKEAIVLPGENATFLLEAQGTLAWCHFFLPGNGTTVKVYFKDGTESDDSTGRHLYYGDGLQRGQCGISLANVSEEDNGPVRGYIVSSTFKADYRYMALIVASPPTAPTLSLVYKGVNLTATCKVNQSRPIAKISWVLGDEVIREDDTDDTEADPKDKWRWPWMKGSIQQILNRKLNLVDNLKVLKCVVSHANLSEPLEANETIKFTGVADYNLTLAPGHERESMNPAPTVFTCDANETVALTGCQFTWWDSRTKTAGPLLDLSQGSKTEANLTLINDTSLIQYKYSSKIKLEEGGCGIELLVRGYTSWMVACRIHTEIGGWQYSWADFYSNNWDSLPHNLTTQREIIVRPGENASVMLRAKEPLRQCTFYMQGVSYAVDFDQGNVSKQNTGRHRYYGAGLDKMECGLNLTNVSDKDNGLVRGFIVTTSRKADYRFISVIIASNLTGYNLSLEYPNPKTSVMATCVVNGSRPVPSITWKLNGVEIRKSQYDDTPPTPKDEWKWPWINGSFQQRLTLHLQDSFNETDLTCVISLPHLNFTTEISETLIFPVLPKPTCPKLEYDAATYVCSYIGTITNCSEPQQLRSKATLKCKTNFAPPDDITYTDIWCKGSGTWVPAAVNCIPDCGRDINAYNQQLVASGKVAKINEFPWHVAIYKEDANKRFMEYICGGSLISTKIVITAAHCNEEGTNSTGTVTFYIAAGKIYSKWVQDNDTDTENYVQRREVETWMSYPKYNGRAANFQADIALLFLKKAVHIANNVNLICLDRNNVFEVAQLVTGKNGSVAGWGYTENQKLSYELRKIELPFVDHQTCKQNLKLEQQSSLTVDKFCAGYVKRNKGLCKGDSGGGLVFKHVSTDKYYIRGIVSTNFKPQGDDSKCYADSYTSFTQISKYYQDFLKEHLQN